MTTNSQREMCRAVVRRLTEKHDWRLLGEADFVAQVLARAQASCASSEEEIARLAINLYCEAWYTACGSADARRDRAYTELVRYLYDRARHKYGDGDLAQEVAHDAVILVAEQLDNCQNPGAFMAFAMLKLWNAATDHFRRRDRRLARIAPLPDEADQEHTPLADPSALQPEAAVVDETLSEALLLQLEEVFRQSPRARNQLQAVLLKFLFGYSDEEIAVALGTDVPNVHVLRSRGLKRLRGDPELRRLARDILGGGS
ncbi:MAG: RNA polymerase sigma factor [Anaerolineae bacterium]